jgi:hypothetical protein
MAAIAAALVIAAAVAATITALPITGLIEEARYERDASGRYGEAAGAGRLACASVRWGVAGGGGGHVCPCAWTLAFAWLGACAGTFRKANKQLIHRNPACGMFNVYQVGEMWRGKVTARGVTLRTSFHTEAWRAAVELEWLLDRWCRRYSELAR